MTNQPLPDLYYRYFCCPSCGYQVQVAGEKFYDDSSRRYMDTFHCIDCNVIHEQMVSETRLDVTLPAYLELKKIFPEFDLHLPGSFRDFSVFEMVSFVEDKVIKNIVCYSCKSGRNIIWSKEFPYCPKCQDIMEMKYKDRPVLEEEALYGTEEQQKIQQYSNDHPGFVRELISGYYSFTEEEIYKYRNKIKWSIGSANWDIQWNSNMIKHCQYYLTWELFSLNSAFRDTQLINEFNQRLTWKAVSDGNVSWSIACNGHIRWTEDLIEEYKDRIDFSGLSVNSNVDWSEHLFEKYEDRWDWLDISGNNGIPWTLPMMEICIDQLNLMGCDLLKMEFNSGMMSNLEILEKYFDMFASEWIFMNGRLPWYKENLLERWADKLDWDGLSQNQNLLRDPLFFEQNMEHWMENKKKRFSALSNCVTLPWSFEFIERYKELWNWHTLSYNEALPWSEEFIDQYADKWDWNGIYKNTGIPWTLDLIFKYNFSDQDLLFKNRSIWDKAIKPHIDDNLLEILINNYL